MRRFGDRERCSAAVPGRPPSEWIELIKTMLPKPVTTNDKGELLGGDPVAVLVSVEVDKIRIMEASKKWDNPMYPSLTGAPFASTPLNTNAARVAELIMAAWGKRVSRYRWCPRCNTVNEPERMNVGNVCDGCAEKLMCVAF
jgi:hypothetical protein